MNGGASSDRDWPDYLVARVRTPAPANCAVVPGSTPVTSFGDPTRATTATLGINPSSAEFLARDGALLEGTKRRLATTISLGIGTRNLDDDDASRVLEDCANYFQRQPYRAWFDPLDGILRKSLDASYYDASACHLDLVQWATSPVWGKLATPVRAQLLDADKGFLIEQLQREHLTTVVVNGRTVMKWVEDAGLVTWSLVGELAGPPRAELFVGQSQGVRFLAWSCNVQSQHGARRHVDDLAKFVKNEARQRG